MKLFRNLFDASATDILDVICEYAPQPPAKFHADRTPLDAIVVYGTEDGVRFMGIETKYMEPFVT